MPEFVRLVSAIDAFDAEYELQCRAMGGRCFAEDAIGGSDELACVRQGLKNITEEFIFSSSIAERSDIYGPNPDRIWLTFGLYTDDNLCLKVQSSTGGKHAIYWDAELLL